MIEGNLRLNVAVPKRMRKNKLIIFTSILILLLILTTEIKKVEGKEEIKLLYLKQKVLGFASQYNRPVIVVSKKEHLLYYCEKGKIVENDPWNGFNYSFPVRVSLAGKYYRTPEGEMATG